MPQHFIQFFDDPISAKRKKLSHAFANSLAAALERAKEQLPTYRIKYPKAGYRIEDEAGRTVAIGPGTHDDV
jgi:hypothetical protein